MSNSVAIREVLKTPLRKGEKRKFHVLECAVECLAKNGIQNATYAEIGRLANMSRSHLVYYFPTKESIVEAVVEYVCLTAQNIATESIEDSSAPKDKLLAMIDAHFEHILNYPYHGQVLIQFFYLCTFEKRFRQLQTSVREMGVERLTHIIVNGWDKTPKQAMLLALNIQAIVGGYLLNLGTTEGLIPVDEAKTEVKRLIMAMLNQP